MYSISELYIYPIKSLGGIAVSETVLTDRGPQHDRRWMLVDENNSFLTQREYPQMALLQTNIEEGQLIVFHKNRREDKIKLSLFPGQLSTVTVKVWDDYCTAQFVSTEADAWFSKQLSISCRLVYMPDNSIRNVDNNYALNGEITGFSDGFPLLMIGQQSLNDLNDHMDQPLPMNRFRPNIVFAGGDPYIEDGMEHFMINTIEFYGVKLCARCPITTTDQETAIRYKEPLKTLASYRSRNNKVYFGQNVLYNKPGVIKIGDTINIIKWKESAAFNDGISSTNII